MGSESAPRSVEVPSADVGRIIGSNGSIIKRLIQATGCNIEVPKGSRDDPGTVVVELGGFEDARRKAAAAILDIVAGGDAEDHIGRGQGAMLISHSLQCHEREAYTQWRLVAAEATLGVTAEVGRKAVRLWSSGRRALSGAVAEAARSAVETALAEAAALTELVVECNIEFDAENASQDASLGPLVYQHGVLVRVPRPESNTVPVRIVGPADAARDAAELLEARFVRGRSTASLLQLPGQVQGMDEAMAADFKNDVSALEDEFRVKVHLGRIVLWIVGAGSDSVGSAWRTLREMLLFYYPSEFELIKGIKRQAVAKLREDAQLRAISARPGCALALDEREGTVWLCGREPARAPARDRINAFMRKWSAEHWELELPNYGAAMWLLGPRGSGEYLARMQTESGAKLQVCPNELCVRAEGPPNRVREAERLVREALSRLEAKQRAEEENGGPVVKPKALLSDHPAHMQSVLAKLAELDERSRLEKQKRVREERERDWARQRAEWMGAGDANEVAVARERSRSREREQGRDDGPGERAALPRE